MRNALTFITAASLIAGGVSAQAETIEDILQDIHDYKAPVEVPVPAASMPNDPAAVAEMPTAAVGLDSVDALIEDGRWHYVAGEFEQAQAGFEKAVQLDPDNLMARMYLRKLLERDHRRAEVQGMDMVRDGWNSDLVLRSYALTEAALEKMQLSNLELGADVANRFPEVAFPEGASAVYQPNLKKIFVRNTRENLQVIEQIFETMDFSTVGPRVEQVEIEAKFVEVSEGTLEELGFQWNFEDAVEVDIGGTDMSVQDGAGGLFADALRGSPNGASSSLPFSQPSSLGYGMESAAGQSAWSTFRFEDTFNGSPSSLSLEYGGSDPMTMIISALDQSTGADVLSAPRVTVLSGEEAVIRVGELHWYPEVYEGDSQQGTMLNVSYQDFEETLLGVELTVTPEVDGNLIELELTPSIMELTGWQNWQLAPANSIYNHRMATDREGYSHDDPVVASLPVFKKRYVETMVTIADGGTIGMGGLINEKVEAFNDKVPVLGNLPLLGRLFRNEGERAIKRNLLMFVTAKKIASSGRVNTTRSFAEGDADSGDDADDAEDDLFSFF